LTLTFKLVRARDQTCLPVNLTQIRSAVPGIFKKSQQTGPKATLCSSLCAVKRYTKKPQNVTSHIFAETTHVVAAPHGFACVVISTAHIFQVSSKSVQGFWSPLRSKFAHSHYFGYWLLQQLVLLRYDTIRLAYIKVRPKADE